MRSASASRFSLCHSNQPLSKGFPVVSRIQRGSRGDFSDQEQMRRASWAENSAVVCSVKCARRFVEASHRYNRDEIVLEGNGGECVCVCVGVCVWVGGLVGGWVHWWLSGIHSELPIERLVVQGPASGNLVLNFSLSSSGCSDHLAPPHQLTQL